MSILHKIYILNSRAIKWAKDIQRRKKDKADILALMMNGACTFTPDQKALVVKFWKPYGRTDPIYQQYYSEKNDMQDVRYLPDDLYYTQIQYYFNDIPAAHIVDHKGYYDVLFPDIKHPEMIAKRINGYWMINNQCVDVETVVVACTEQNIVFVKPATGSCGGSGIQVLEDENLCKEKILEAISSIEGDIVIQKRLEQCAELSQLNEASVNTMRIMSLIDKKREVVILSRSLRMGVGKKRLDNAHSGGIFVGIHEDGRLRDFAMTLKGERFYVHPASGVEFKNTVLPNMAEVEASVKKCALRIPAFRIVAWDIILDKDHAPTLVEANLYNAGMDVPQLANGPLFGDRTNEYLNEVYATKGGK